MIRFMIMLLLTEGETIHNNHQKACNRPAKMPHKHTPTIYIHTHTYTHTHTHAHTHKYTHTHTHTHIHTHTHTSKSLLEEITGTGEINPSEQTH